MSVPLRGLFTVSSLRFESLPSRRRAGAPGARRLQMRMRKPRRRVCTGRVDTRPRTHPRTCAHNHTDRQTCTQTHTHTHTHTYACRPARANTRPYAQHVEMVSEAVDGQMSGLAYVPWSQEDAQISRGFRRCTRKTPAIWSASSSQPSGWASSLSMPAPRIEHTVLFVSAGVLRTAVTRICVATVPDGAPARPRFGNPASGLERVTRVGDRLPRASHGGTHRPRCLSLVWHWVQRCYRRRRGRERWRLPVWASLGATTLPAAPALVAFKGFVSWEMRAFL